MLPFNAPAKGLPDWVVAIYEARHPVYLEYLDPKISRLQHRGEAFFRLFSSADRDMIEVWARVPGYEALRTPKPARFVDCLILATDATMQMPLGSESPARDESPPRLRSKEQRLARKLGALLSELQLLMPATTIDGQVRDHTHWFGEERETLSREFAVDIPPTNLRIAQEKYGITEVADSKRGYIQHRRAADSICARAKAVASSLNTCRPADWLISLIRELEMWPQFEDEKTVQPLLFSQKATWADWLTQASLMLAESYEKPFLRLKDWQVLVGLLFDTWPDLQKISEILKRSSNGKNHN